MDLQSTALPLGYVAAYNAQLVYQTLLIIEPQINLGRVNVVNNYL
jgi:hypothetical protein